MEKKTLLSELRMYEINPIEKITNESLTKAITVNAEINNLGFTMLPKDIIRLASDAHPENLLKLIKDGESSTVEFKTAKKNLPDSLFETVCSMLNRNG